jgi:ribosome recycling factor
MSHAAVTDAAGKMGKALEVLSNELKAVRTGRASPALIENVKVDYYGAPTPLKSLANIAAPEPQLLVVKPFDPGSLAEIVKAIQKADIGLNPQNDGKVLRVAVPPLSGERRKQLAQQVKEAGEAQRVAVRNVRRDANKRIDDEEKAKKISEDEKFRLKDEIQKMTEKHEKQIDELLAKKSKEILEG